MPKKQTKQARADAIANELSELAAQIEDLKQEMEDWRESLPENMQAGDRYDAIGQCASDLDDILGAVSESC